MPEVIAVNTKTASEELLAEMWDMYEVLQRETHPDDPMTPHEQQIANWRTEESQFRRVPRFVVRDDNGDLVATAVVVLDMDNNTDNGFCRVTVMPDQRGKGYARLLAKPVLDAITEAGRIRVDTWVVSDQGFGGLPERLGMKLVYRDRESVLEVSDLDMSLMDRWIERAQERASDYELIHLSPPLTDWEVEKYCDMTAVMNTAPREDYQAEDEVVTPEMWHQLEREMEEQKGTLHICIAVHSATGEWAGYTVIKTQELQPEVAHQWDTGVDPKHRNQGLGRWVKAANIKAVLASHPAIERVHTNNAGSNEPMLNINVEMGFKPHMASEAWQGDLAVARERAGL